MCLRWDLDYNRSCIYTQGCSRKKSWITAEIRLNWAVEIFDSQRFEAKLHWSETNAPSHSSLTISAFAMGVSGALLTPATLQEGKFGQNVSSSQFHRRRRGRTQSKVRRSRDAFFNTKRGKDEHVFTSWTVVGNLMRPGVQRVTARAIQKAHKQVLFHFMAPINNGKQSLTGNN